MNTSGKLPAMGRRFAAVSATSALALLLCAPGCQLHRVDQLDAAVERQDSRFKELGNKISDITRRVEASNDLLKEQQHQVKLERADTKVLVDDLRIELQRLRGDMEQLDHDVGRLRIELDKTRSDLETQMQGGKNSEESDLVVYDRVLKKLLDEKDYAGATRGFSQFLKKYPKSNLADNAIYWMGESHFARKSYKEAIVEFQKILDNYEKSDKSCAALLKIGRSFQELEEKDKAKLFFEETVARCKEKKEAKKAATLLKALTPTAAKKTKSKKKSAK